MTHPLIVEENGLDNWVRCHSREAQGIIVDLVYRLIISSVPKPKELRFPLSDSIEQPGPDGVLVTDLGLEPYIPEGRSYWEIGAGINPGEKATKDYKKLTNNTPYKIRISSTFVFVTPLSGRRSWPYTREKNEQADWIEKRRQLNDWQDVRVIDGTRLISWLGRFPAVEIWLAEMMGIRRINLIQTPEQHWAELETIGSPPPLIPQIFLENRELACEKLKDIFFGSISQLRIDTHFPDQVADFVSAYIITTNNENKLQYVGRCLIISDSEAWDNTITHLRDPHILIASFDIGEEGSRGTRTLEKASRAGHKIIYTGLPGGTPDPYRVSIPNPKPYQIEECLKKAGYSEERARVLAQRSNGNLNFLIRCLYNFSLTPEWAQKTDASDLAIAELLGAWDENNKSDKMVAEKLSKKLYGEWIGIIRNIAAQPDTPLVIHNRKWKVFSRYEGWYELGPRIFDDHLEILKEIMVNVLREKDPKFMMPPDKRYTASIHGKILSHSGVIRNGLAETLALLGSHPKALTSCSLGKAEEIAVLSVRDILSNADWILWATLNDLLPLLAEAAPSEFLSSIEKALNSDPCPFNILFSQENTEFMGNNYMTGVLWALETLAWDEEHFIRVLMLLGDLSSRDPGGNWANRPLNSISTILLPWLPQTCASVEKKKNAVETLIYEYPSIAWKVLIALLPSTHQISYGTHKPIWRETIPENWSKGVKKQENWEQTIVYADLIVKMAKENSSNLIDLIPHLNELPRPSFEAIIKFLDSKKIKNISETDRLQLWENLVELIRKHKRFENTNWSIKGKYLSKIETIAKKLEPSNPVLLYKSLFSERDFDLYEDIDNYEKSAKKLNDIRKNAIIQILKTSGLQAIIVFAKNVESPFRVGIALGGISENNNDKAIIPNLIEESTDRSLKQFSGGYIWEKFHLKGWQWVDSFDTSKWSPAQIGQFLAYLPFKYETWQRAVKLLGENNAMYWEKANVNPYQAQKNINFAISYLIKHGRPYEAITCIYKVIENKHYFDTNQAITALHDILEYPEKLHSSNSYIILEVIKALQENSKVNRKALLKIEWGYLPLLDGDHKNIYPKILEQHLADNPEFFCEIIGTIFLSSNEKQTEVKPTEKRKNMAENAYRLLTQWRIPPGIQKDGTFIGKELNLWLKKVKASCIKTGHLKPALTMVGHVFIHMPPDPDGLWINHFAAKELNKKDSEEIRKGFKTALFNSRGVYGFTSGKEEKNIAEKYKKQAEEVEVHGYHRLATSLRELASSYERLAEHDATENLLD